MWKRGLGVAILNGDLQGIEAQISNCLGHPGAVGLAQSKFAEADFDGDLPYCGRTQQPFVIGILDRGMGFRTEEMVLIDTPNDRVRGEEEPHSMWSLNSSSGASKSGAMYRTVPRSVPRRGGHRADFLCTITLATVWPSRVINNSSPGLSLSINSARRACASSIVTVAMTG